MATLAGSSSQAAPADKTARVSQFGPVLWTWLVCTRVYAKVSTRRAGGAVINIASVGRMGADPDIGTTTPRRPLTNLAGQLADVLGPHMRINAIAPGLVKTDTAGAIWEPASTS